VWLKTDRSQFSLTRIPNKKIILKCRTKPLSSSQSAVGGRGCMVGRVCGKVCFEFGVEVMDSESDDEADKLDEWNEKSFVI